MFPDLRPYAARETPPRHRYTGRYSGGPAMLGIVIAHSLSTISKETVRKLQELNDMKEALLESEFPGTYAAMGPLKR
ncbi:hypothetical protein [Rhizobium leguminosarum]|uniref:hypothetical protein n=1 Tax=Rhizobium leguminosarum TaxID=384 RepID=UPI001C960845|nr:hypothetical protein [Rhizobium leguminosarum]MBY5725214.1 hypothetical protein [Rhizobium leguminosarum]